MSLALPLQLLRNGRDRAQVLGDVLAGHAVAARRADREAPVLVLQRDREPVELRLGDEADRLGDRAAGYACPTRAARRARTRCRATASARGARPARTSTPACPPGRCVGESAVTSDGILRLELAQLAHQRVELGVGDLGLVEHEVALVVVLDQLAQLRDACRRPSCGRTDFGRARAATPEIYAPTASFVAAAWSCTRLPISRASNIARSAWLSPWPARPHAGATSAWPRKLHRIAAAPGQLAPRVEERLPQRLRLLADRPVRRDRAPRDPAAAVEEARERGRRRRGRARRRRSARPAGRRRARAGDRRAPHTCTPDTPAHAASAVDSRSVATSRSIGPSAPRQHTSAGSSKKHTSAGARAGAPTRAPRSRARPGPRDTRTRAGTRASASMPGFDERDAERQRPGDCTLTCCGGRGWRAATSRNVSSPRGSRRRTRSAAARADRARR